MSGEKLKEIVKKAMNNKHKLLFGLILVLFGYCFAYENLIFFGVVPGYSSLPASIEPALPAAPWAFVVGWVVIFSIIVFRVMGVLGGDDS